MSFALLLVLGGFFGLLLVAFGLELGLRFLVRDDMFTLQEGLGLLQREVFFVTKDVAKLGHGDLFFVRELFGGLLVFLIVRGAHFVVFLDFGLDSVFLTGLLFVLYFKVMRKFRLANREGGIVAFRRIVNGNIGRDARGLNRAARRGVVTSCRDLDAGRLIFFIRIGMMV